MSTSGNGMVRTAQSVKLRSWLLLVGLSTSTAVAALGHRDLFGCDGCHTPQHRETLPSVPLWNDREETKRFVMYSGDAIQSTADGQSSRNSKLCLACHDGSNSGYAWMDADHSFGAHGRGGAHPISFVYDSALADRDGTLKDPSEASTLGGTIREDLLDTDGRVQCGSCHDVHSSGVGDSLLRGYDYERQRWAELCRMCHLR